MWDKNSVFPKIKTGYAFQAHMRNVFDNDFNNQTFIQDGNINAISKIKLYNPPNIIFQQLQDKEKVKNIEVNRMRNGHVIEALTSVDIQEIVNRGGKVI